MGFRRGDAPSSNLDRQEEETKLEQTNKRSIETTRPLLLLIHCSFIASKEASRKRINHESLQQQQQRKQG